MCRMEAICGICSRISLQYAPTGKIHVMTHIESRQILVLWILAVVWSSFRIVFVRLCVTFAILVVLPFCNTDHNIRIVRFHHQGVSYNKIIPKRRPQTLFLK